MLLISGRVQFSLENRVLLGFSKYFNTSLCLIVSKISVQVLYLFNDSTNVFVMLKCSPCLMKR